MPVARVPPWVKISQRPGSTVRASIATTMHWVPNLFAASATTSGVATAAVTARATALP